MKENTRKALIVWSIIALLLITIRALHAQRIQSAQNECTPAQVEWRQDSLKVESWGCVDFRGDTLLLIRDISSDGHPHNIMWLLKKEVISITKLELGKTVTVNRNGGT